MYEFIFALLCYYIVVTFKVIFNMVAEDARISKGLDLLGDRNRLCKQNERGLLFLHIVLSIFLLVHKNLCIYVSNCLIDFRNPNFAAKYYYSFKVLEYTLIFWGDVGKLTGVEFWPILIMSNYNGWAHI